ncbi:MAG: integrase, partial [Maritimibacter sp.]
MAGLIKRGETWHLRMRVPKRYLDVAGRSEIHRSLHTQSKREAEDLRPGYKAQILEELEHAKARGAKIY